MEVRDWKKITNNRRWRGTKTKKGRKRWTWGTKPVKA